MARSMPFIRQTEAAECGLACLAMVASHFGLNTDINTLRRRFTISLKGMTFKTLADVAERVGLNVRPLKCDLEELERIATPAVLWVLAQF